ncbi:flagellar hook-associated protein FlgK [Marinomonas dokdonensis]|uniref:flagellar hook-associated protein FlgK n=1 Tax=Marinomonas dokdonensis TaxID=328224 RepID=UPI0040559B1D
MGSNLYGIGLSGLQSSNARINTTGQNTANVDTEGYSRQKTNTSSSHLGGVEVRDTTRLVDNMINSQVRADTSNHSYYDTYNNMMSLSDGLLAEDSVSLNNYLNDAFKALQAVNNDPASPGLRNLAHSSLGSLVEQYKVLSSMTADQSRAVDNQLEASLKDLNSLTKQVAHLNDQILRQESNSYSPANELRDQQELLAVKIAEYIDTETQFNDEGVMSISLANGQPLVLDRLAPELEMAPDPLDPKRIKLTVDLGRHEVGIKSEDLGGSIGALVDYRRDFSIDTDRTLGQSAISIADAMNQQNALGLDANGLFGRDLFSFADIKIQADKANTGKTADLEVRVSPGNSANILKDTYELIKTGDNSFLVQTYDLNGEPSRRSVNLDVSAAPDKNGFYQVADLGVDVNFGDLSDYEIGDTFQFSPTQGMASSFQLAAKNGDDIALSGPMNVYTDSGNLSEAKISLSSVTNTDPDSSAFASSRGLYPNAPHSIHFMSNNEFQVRDANGGVLASIDNVQDYQNLLEQAGLAEKAGFDVSLSSMPMAGDVFSMDMENIGVSNNFNGLLLGELQNENLVAGRQSISEAFSDLVAQVGSKSAELESNAKSSEIIMNQSMARRDSISAVSLDEEAVNLLKYQQSYSASAQVITAARTAFETLLGAVR